jgi:hypothetical protein
MREWGMLEQPPRLQSSVRKVLSELSAEALPALKDPRLELKGLSTADLERVDVVLRRLVIGTLTSVPTDQQWADAWRRWVLRHPHLATIGHSVWAYFPVHRGRYIARPFPPKPETRVLLIFGAPAVSEEPVKLFEGRLRHHLGHVLRYLWTPQAPNECADADREWHQSTEQTRLDEFASAERRAKRRAKRKEQ